MLASRGALLGKKEIIERLTSKGDERIFIGPLLSSKQVQPASVDVRLGQDFLVIKIGKITHLEPTKDPFDVEREVNKYTDKYKIINRHESFIIHPGEFVLGATLEYVRLPNDIAARLEGRSSWGRLGIVIHATAGYIDPGFRGQITFELKNMGKVPIPLYPGVRMAQLSFFHVENDEPYEGKYQESYGVIPSRYFDDDEYKRMRNSIKADYSTYPFDELFDAIKSGGDIPPAPYPQKIPKEILDAIRSAYERYQGETDDE